MLEELTSSGVDVTGIVNEVSMCKAKYKVCVYNNYYYNTMML